jgi:glycosyltransferase involved in cell wall biosynthesis
MTPTVSLVLTLHREGPLVQRTLLSLSEAAVYAGRLGIATELVTVLDRADDATRSVLEGFDGAAFVARRSIAVDNGSLGPSRNDGVGRATGRFVAMCDGDDLVSFNIIADSVRCATAADARTLFFPEWLMGFGVLDFLTRYQGLDRVTPLAFLQTHPYTSRVFARREVFAASPYRDLRLGAGYAFEDWDFNAACVASGCDIRVVPDTMLFYRQRAQSLLRQADSVSIRQIPPNPLHRPDTFLRVTAEARCRVAERPEAFAEAEFRPKPRMLDRPALRLVVQAANAIEPQIDIAATAASRRMHANVSERAIRAGRAYADACAAAAPAAPFDEVFLLPFAGTGGAELYLANVMQALREVTPGLRILAILGETPAVAEARRTLPEGVVACDLGSDGAEVPTPDRLLVALRLIENLAPGARLHLRDSTFADGFFTAWRPVLADRPTVFYRFSDGRENRAGDLFTRPGGFAFVSEHLVHLDRVVTDTESLSAQDRARIALWPERFVALPGRCVPRVTAAAIRTRPVADGFRLLWASRLDPEKRPELVPRIARLLAQRDPGIRIEMHGRAVFGGFDPALLEGLPNLAWHGPYDGFATIDTAGYDAFLYTSWFDGMPNVVLEAAAAGLPIVAPDVGGIGEFVEDGTTGLLLPPIAEEDVAAEAYAAAIMRLRADPALRSRVALAALARLEDRHAPARHRARVAALFPPRTARREAAA